MGAFRLPRPMLGCGGGCFFGLGCFLVAVGMGGVELWSVHYVGWGGIGMGGYIVLDSF